MIFWKIPNPLDESKVRDFISSHASCLFCIENAIISEKYFSVHRKTFPLHSREVERRHLNTCVTDLDSPREVSIEVLPQNPFRGFHATKGKRKTIIVKVFHFCGEWKPLATLARQPSVHIATHMSMFHWPGRNNDSADRRRREILKSDGERENDAASLEKWWDPISRSGSKATRYRS